MDPLEVVRQCPEAGLAGGGLLPPHPLPGTGRDALTTNIGAWSAQG